MDTTKAITHIGLCAGYGGIELGLQRAIPDLRSVALCEIEAFAVANLVAKMEAGLMDPAPIWPNLKTFPWEAFRDRVDILTGGYPCQPFSAAGKRQGADDPRHLWPYIAKGIRILQPRLCFFENVEGHISLGLSDVIEDLAGLGYRTTWGIFSASEVGAPHQRKRVFIMAYRNGARLERYGRHVAFNDSERRQASDGLAWPSRPGEQQYGWEPPRVVADSHRIDRSAPAEGREHDRQAGSTGEELADTGSISRGTSGRQLQSEQLEEGGRHSETTKSGSGNDHGPAGEELANTGCERQEERQIEAGGSEQSDEVRDVADSGFIGSDRRPDGSCRWSGESGEAGVNAAGCGGQGDGLRQTQPPLGGNPDGPSSGLDYAQLCVACDNRTDELRLLGNGVVPHTAELAFRVLIQELSNE